MKKAMRTNKKSLCQILVVLALIVSMVLPAVVVNRADASTTFKSGDAYYKILSSSGKTVEYVRPAKKTYTVICIPITVKIKGKDYRVVSVSANACKGCTKLKWITVGMSVEKIGKNAFAGCKKLKGVDIDSERLTAKSVGANAFKGINEKALVTVPQQKLAAYKKFLKARGITGKKQKIKGVKWISDFDPKVSQFEMKSMIAKDVVPTRFEFADANGEKTSKYFAGDTVKLESQISFLPPIYGHWERDERELIGNASYCNTCHRYFSSYMYGIHAHDGMWFDHSKVCMPSCYITGVTGKGIHSWVFVPDPDPCKFVASYVLPEGLTCSKEDVKVANVLYKIDLTNACNINVTGNRVTVTINDVKAGPFYRRSNYEGYINDMKYKRPKIKKGELQEETRQFITIQINAKADSRVGKDNVITNSVSYEYKGSNYTYDMPDISFHTASMKIVGCTDTNGNSLDGAEYDLYRTKTTWNENGLGVGDWLLFASGLHVGDVVTGLGTGYNKNVEGQYRLVQTKTPTGYLLAQPFDFSLTIDTNGKVKISAVDDDDNELPVENGTVMVTFVNYNKSKYPNSSSNNPENDDDASSGNSNAGNGGTNTGGSSSNSGTVEKKAVATYYKDGIRQFWYTHGAEEFDASGMMDTGSVSDYASADSLQGCHLEKITVNGETVDSLPAKIPYGTEIGFWYVTD